MFSVAKVSRPGSQSFRGSTKWILKCNAHSIYSIHTHCRPDIWNHSSIRSHWNKSVATAKLQLYWQKWTCHSIKTRPRVQVLLSAAPRSKRSFLQVQKRRLDGRWGLFAFFQWWIPPQRRSMSPIGSSSLSPWPSLHPALSPSLSLLLLFPSQFFLSCRQRLAAPRLGRDFSVPRTIGRIVQTPVKLMHTWIRAKREWAPVYGSQAAGPLLLFGAVVFFVMLMSQVHLMVKTGGSSRGMGLTADRITGRMAKFFSFPAVSLEWLLCVQYLSRSHRNRMVGERRGVGRGPVQTS